MKRIILMAVFVMPFVAKGQYVHGEEYYRTEQGVVRIFHDSLMVVFKPELSFPIHGWERNENPQTGVAVERSYGKDSSNVFTVTMWDSVIVNSEILIPPFRFYSKDTRSVNVIKL